MEHKVLQNFLDLVWRIRNCPDDAGDSSLTIVSNKLLPDRISSPILPVIYRLGGLVDHRIWDNSNLRRRLTFLRMATLALSP